MVGRVSCFGACVDKLKNAGESRYERRLYLLLVFPVTDIFGKPEVFCEKEGDIHLAAALQHLFMPQQNLYVLKVLGEGGILKGVSQQSTFSEYFFFRWKSPPLSAYECLRCKNILLVPLVLEYKVCLFKCFCEVVRIFRPTFPVCQ